MFLVRVETVVRTQSFLFVRVDQELCNIYGENY